LIDIDIQVCNLIKEKKTTGNLYMTAIVRKVAYGMIQTFEKSTSKRLRKLRRGWLGRQCSSDIELRRRED
jgi:hypothetical protein